MNKKFRKKNKVTDVLSFPYYSSNEIKNRLKKRDNIYLGDVALNLYKITNLKNFRKEFNKLWIHGFLHLMGYKHYRNSDFYKK